MKHSRNPEIAFQQGYKAGLAEQIDYAYLADEIINEAAYYNIIDNHIKTKKTQMGLFKDLIEARKKLKLELAEDEDKIAILVRDINKVRAEFKEPLILWKK